MDIFNVRTSHEITQFLNTYKLGDFIKIQGSTECWEIDDFNPIRNYLVRVKNWKKGHGTTILGVDIRHIESKWSDYLEKSDLTKSQAEV